MLLLATAVTCDASPAQIRAPLTLRPGNASLRPTPEYEAYIRLSLNDVTWLHSCQQGEYACFFCNPSPCGDPNGTEIVRVTFLTVGQEYSLELSSVRTEEWAVGAMVPQCFELQYFDTELALWTNYESTKFCVPSSTDGVVHSTNYHVRIMAPEPSRVMKVHDERIPADDESETSATVPGETNLTWSIDGDALNCRLRTINTNSAAIITAGDEEGTIVIKAVSGTSGCTYYGLLELTTCGSCSQGSCNGFGDSVFDNRSVHFKMSLGRSTTEEESYLLVRSATMTSALSTPASLQHPLHRDDVRAVYVEGVGLQQLHTRSGVVIIPIPVSQYSYDVLFYGMPRTNQPLVLGSDGLYTVPPGVNPDVQYTVTNPDMASSMNRLWITETRGTTIQRTWKYTYVPATGTMELEDDQGVRKISAWTEGSTRKRSFGSGGIVAYVEGKTRASIGGRNPVSGRFRGTGTNTLTTTYSFYTSGADYGIGEVSQIDFPDTSWEMREYSDWNKRISARYSPWGVSPASKASTNRYRLETYIYGTTNVVDDCTWKPHLPRITTVSLRKDANNIAAVGRTFHKYEEFYEEEQRCTDPSAGWNNSGNIRTATAYYSSGDYQHWPQWQRKENGTYVMWSYSTLSGVLTTTEDWGAATVDGNGVPQQIVNGFRRRVERGSRGEVQSDVVKRITQGIESITTESRVYTYPLGDYLHKSMMITYLNGRTTTNTYSCCGEAQEVDEDGTITTFTADHIGRPKDITRLGITERSILDAAGRKVRRERIDTGNATHVLDEWSYNDAGELRLHRNALLGETTVYDWVAYGRRTNIVVSPDGGVVTNAYANDGALLKSTGATTSPVRNSWDYDTGGRPTGTAWPTATAIVQSATGTDTLQWTKETYDALGRKAVVMYAHATTPPSELWSYNGNNQLERVVDPDNVTTLYRYNSEGEVSATGIDVNRDGALANYDVGNSGSDRVTITRRYYLAAADATNGRGSDIVRVDTSMLISDNATNEARITRVDASTDGLSQWQVLYQDQTSTGGVLSSNRVVYGTGGLRYITNAAPDGSYVLTMLSYGRDSLRQQRDPTGAIKTQTSYLYDSQGRMGSSTDLRNGTTVYTYNDADLVSTITTPAPGDGTGQQTTTNWYDGSLRLKGVSYADGRWKTNIYSAQGLLTLTYGNDVYPVEYVYDSQGRMTELHTWQDFTNATKAVTLWKYNDYRNFLDYKRYPDPDGAGTKQPAGPDYEYSAGGRLTKRKWARSTVSGRLTATYTYGFNDGVNGNDHGDLLSIVYSNDPASTPQVSFGYDRRGRRTSANQGGSSVQKMLVYNDAQMLVGETNVTGALAGIAISNRFDAVLRRQSLLEYLSTSGTPTVSLNYGYDNLSRMNAVTNGSLRVLYGYTTNTLALRQAIFMTNATVVMTTTYERDRLDRVSSVRSVASAANQLAMSYSYGYDSVNRRKSLQLEDGSKWAYEYDDLGQLTSARRKWSDQTFVAGQQFTYDYDDIGNRRMAAYGGNTNGANLRVALYTNNAANWLMSRGTPRDFDVVGAANANATVTVNSLATDSRHGEYFQKSITVAAATNSAWQTVNVTAVNGGSSSNWPAGSVFVGPQPEVFDYDDDGNLISDGRWTYTWDAENRLVAMNVRTANGPQYRLAFGYDVFGRRVAKTAWRSTNSVETCVLNRLFVYDGWNLLAELNAADNRSVVATYVWGLDLSGTEQGAGGVGGLLMQNVTGTNALFCAYDGNGNVVGLVDATNGKIVANLEYGPFGESIRVSSALAGNWPFRFSTKYEDAETGYVYYGYRYYNPSSGRWLSRDRIGENGGVNLCSFVANRPVNRSEVLGMFSTAVHVQITSWAYSRLGEGCRPCCSSKGFFESLVRGAIAPDLAMDFPGSTGAFYPWMSDLNTGLALVDEEFFPSRVARGVEGAVSAFGGWLVPDAVQNWWQNQSIGGTLILIGNQIDSTHFGPLYQTHFGRNAWQHGMSTSGQTALEVHQSLVNGSLAMIMEYRKGVDSGNCEKAAFALGKALHYLQDTYSESHTQRGNRGILMFQDYGLQSALRHAGADSPSPSSDAFGNAVGATSSLICMAGDKRLSEAQLRSRLEKVFFQLDPGAVAGDTLPDFKIRPTPIPPLTAP